MQARDRQRLARFTDQPREEEGFTALQLGIDHSVLRERRLPTKPNKMKL